MNKRGSGILLHVTSLPSPFGIGDLGPGAYGFADFLQEAGQSYWQILPLNPTDPFHDHSPYRSPSAFAGNPLLISPELLAGQGLVEEKELAGGPDGDGERVDFPGVLAWKEEILELAFDRFRKRSVPDGYEAFCRREAFWLNDVALFNVLRRRFPDRVWSEWPGEIRDRDPEATGTVRERHAEAFERERFFQYLFFVQWASLKRYCNERGIRIIGDIPIYVDYHSADVWAHPGLFKLDSKKKPLVAAGVPPDYFSKTGQLWGNPLYQWDALRAVDFDWWLRRIEVNLTLCDLVRIDHFRGLVAYWEVPVQEKTAVNGSWVEAPAEEFLTEVSRRFPELPIIAEDLGTITPEVREIMDRFKLPGMKPLLFAFGGECAGNPYIPHNLPVQCIAYTGTHDNNTVKGWFLREAELEERKNLIDYLGREVSGDGIAWALIRLLMMSVANTVIFPMQDILSLDEDARMNRPATKTGNWRWRLKKSYLTPDLAGRLLKITRTYGRI